MAKLFITDYASYNAGLQFVIGQWYDLEDYDDVEELENQVKENYRNAINSDSNTAKLYAENWIDIEDLELMVTDYEGFPKEYYSESWDYKLIQKILDAKDIIEEFESIDDDTLLSYYHTYCSLTNEDMLYEFDEDFFRTHFSDPYESARCVHFGDVSWSHNYIRFDGAKNLESFESATDVIDEDELLIHIIENRSSYNK